MGLQLKDPTFKIDVNKKVINEKVSYKYQGQGYHFKFPERKFSHVSLWLHIKSH